MGITVTSDGNVTLGWKFPRYNQVNQGIVLTSNGSCNVDQGSRWPYIPRDRLQGYELGLPIKPAGRIAVSLRHKAANSCDRSYGLYAPLFLYKARKPFWADKANTWAANKMGSGEATQRGTYLFKRDHRSTIRLNYLHGLVVKLTGGLLHPAIPRPTGSACVADICTGTAIWPTELTSEIPPTVSIDGFDISPTQFPNRAYWPTNVRLHTQDCFKPFPERFHCSFDIVVIRFVVILINKTNLKPFIENLRTLLKPGGYIQWTEPDNTVVKALSPNPSIKHPVATQLSELIKNPAPNIQVEWVHELADTLRSAGFEDVRRTDYPVPDKLKPFFSQVHLMSFEDAQTANTSLAPSQTSRDEAVSQLNSEFDAGVTIDWAFLCITGRKL